MSTLLWTQMQDIGPPPRASHAMVYDPVAKLTWLFGGRGDGTARYGDTWSWDGEYWRQAQDIGPAPRWGHVMTFDSDRGRTVLFGGTTWDNSMLGDTWEWNGSLWTQVDDTGPSSRYGAAAAYDGARRRWLLFGGVGATPHVLGDTWEWNGAGWSQVADTGPLPGRLGAMMGYDPAGARAVLVGGFSEAMIGAADAVVSNHGSGVTETWEFAGAGWVQIADTGPEWCGSAAFGFVNGTGVLHGGIGSKHGMPGTLATYGGTWLWRQRRWTKVQEMGPSPRSAHCLTFDVERQRLVLFGGHDERYTAGAGPSVTGDTWESTSVDIPA